MCPPAEFESPSGWARSMTYVGWAVRDAVACLACMATQTPQCDFLATFRHEWAGIQQDTPGLGARLVKLLHARAKTVTAGVQDSKFDFGAKVCAIDVLRNALTPPALADAFSASGRGAAWALLLQLAEHVAATMAPLTCAKTADEVQRLASDLTWSLHAAETSGPAAARAAARAAQPRAAELATDLILGVVDSLPELTTVSPSTDLHSAIALAVNSLVESCRVEGAYPSDSAPSAAAAASKLCELVLALQSAFTAQMRRGTHVFGELLEASDEAARLACGFASEFFEAWGARTQGTGTFAGDAWAPHGWQLLEDLTRAALSCIALQADSPHIARTASACLVADAAERLMLTVRYTMAVLKVQEWDDYSNKCVW